jgi:hypothetical protein
MYFLVHFNMLGPMFCTSLRSPIVLMAPTNTLTFKKTIIMLNNGGCPTWSQLLEQMIIPYL